MRRSRVYDAGVAASRSLIALLTDFGTRDPYVASMKGVIRARTGAELLDLTHEIAAFDRFEAAAFLHACLPWLPASGERYRRVIICAVVDPGVGSSRELVIAEWDSRVVIAPDNGLLTPLIGDGARVQKFATAPSDLADVSGTFHGRDRFAPLAAAIAEGYEWGELGMSVDPGELQPAPWWPAPERNGASVTGTVISVDRFGNCITDVRSELLGAHTAAVLPGGKRIALSVSSYADGRDGGAFMIIGSRGTVELSCHEASAADLLQISRGDRVRFEPVE